MGFPEKSFHLKLWINKKKDVDFGKVVEIKFWVK